MLAAQCKRFRPAYAVVGEPGSGQAAHRDARDEADLTRSAARRRGIGPGRLLAEVDAVMAAIVGAAGLAADARGGQGRQARVAGQQGSTGDGRGGIHGRGASRRRAAAADRQRAQRDLPVHARRLPGDMARGGVRRDPADRFRRAVSRPRRWSSCDRDAGAGGGASELVDGPQDLGRFGNHDEQGAGSDRGALAVQRAGGPNRGGDPPAKRDPFAGGL
jgi:hypothetical protein